MGILQSTPVTHVVTKADDIMPWLKKKVHYADKNTVFIVKTRWLRTLSPKDQESVRDLMVKRGYICTEILEDPKESPDVMLKMEIKDKPWIAKNLENLADRLANFLDNY